MIEISSPIFAIARHRFNVDGTGVVTLVTSYGCPLRCKYCLNQICWQKPTSRSWRTPEELYNEVKKDELYYITTNGGVTFGGGEPMLRAEFIREFRKLCGSLWKIRLETSLCANVDILSQLVPVVDEWIIDIKSISDTRVSHPSHATSACSIS